MSRLSRQFGYLPRQQTARELLQALLDHGDFDGAEGGVVRLVFHVPESLFDTLMHWDADHAEDELIDEAACIRFGGSGAP